MSAAIWRWLPVSDTYKSLDLAGLLLLADVSAIARRTALKGTSSYLDALVLCPGLHKEQDAANLSGGEYPACAAMTTGYVFRVENEATVFYLQKIGRPGQLTTLSVFDANSSRGPLFTGTAYIAHLLTTYIFLGIYSIGDWWTFSVIGTLVLIRLMSVMIIRRRAAMGWKGEPEPGVQGDLLILLSQDRWIRMRGAVDDLKAVTSGQWLREPTSFESTITTSATLAIYLAAMVVPSATLKGQLSLVGLLLVSTVLLGIDNESTKDSVMYGRRIVKFGVRQKYARRLDLAKQLIKETGRDDWAARMGMIQRTEDTRHKDAESQSHERGPVIM